MFSTFNSLITSLYPTAPSRASVLKEEAMESDVEALRKSFASDGQGSVMSAPVTSDDEGVSVQTRSSGGRKRCLFIGINYFGQRNELRGCIADAYNLKSFLSSTYAIPNTDDCMRLLTDEPFHQGTSSYPTRDNILEALCWLVKGAQPGDSLFLHYSGHGGLRKTANGTELTGYDQTIYPVDYIQTGPIDDDELNLTIVQPLTADVRLTCLFDCCHSGTILDLPIRYSEGQMITDPLVQLPIPPHGCGSTLMKNIMSGLRSLHPVRARLLRSPTEADIVCFSACRDEQLSSDVCYLGEGCFGVMSHMFVKVLRKNPHETYNSILKKTDSMLFKFGQSPCLSSNHAMDMNQPFNL